MTITFNSVVSNRFKLPALKVTNPFARNGRLSLVWNFKFGSLGFVCISNFGGCSFSDFVKQVFHLRPVIFFLNVGALEPAVLSLDSPKSFFYSHAFISILGKAGQGQYK